MYWYNYLYADKKVHHISRLKYKIEKGMPHKRCVSYSFTGMREHSAEVTASPAAAESLSQEPLCIIGIGSSRGAALELIRKIIDEVYHQGNF
ncbi:MAG: hypothetical protein ACLUD0_10640 [Eubacterium ramulus]